MAAMSDSSTPPGPAVRAPASSANLGAGFDVFGLALAATADVGLGPAPHGAHAVDEHHPAAVAFRRLGGSGPLWLRTSIPMARGLGFSGAVRVAGAALGAWWSSSQPGPSGIGDAGVAEGVDAIARSRGQILDVVGELEGHADNAAATLYGGFVAVVEGRAIAVPLGPQLAAACVVAWVPDATTSTDRSRRTLATQVDRADAVHNIAHAVQFALAVERDDPELLRGATSDRLHQQQRLAELPGAAEAIEVGVAAGAWCGWLSGSGPTVALLCAHDVADDVDAALPGGATTKQLAIDPIGVRPLDTP